MARAHGYDIEILMRREAAYGELPPAAPGSWVRMPFHTCALGAEQPLEDDPVLGLGTGREAQDPVYGAINGGGDLAVPIDGRYFGLWLASAFGDPVTVAVDAATFKHTFTSARRQLPSYAIEVGHPFLATPKYYVNTGCMVNTLAWNWQRSGQTRCTVGLMSQGEDTAAASQDAAPSGTADIGFERAGQFQGSIKRAGAPVANLSGATLTFSNTLEEIPAIREDGKIDGLDPGLVSLRGELQTRLADGSLYDRAIARTPIDLEFAYTLSPALKLVVTAHRLFLPRPKLGVEAPGGIPARFSLHGAFNPTAGATVTVDLINDLDGEMYRR